MSERGKRNPACGLDTIGLKTTGMVRYNFGAAELYEEALRRGEARQRGADDDDALRLRRHATSPAAVSSG